MIHIMVQTMPAASGADAAILVAASLGRSILNEGRCPCADTLRLASRVESSGLTMIASIWIRGIGCCRGALVQAHSLATACPTLMFSMRVPANGGPLPAPGASSRPWWTGMASRQRCSLDGCSSGLPVPLKHVHAQRVSLVRGCSTCLRRSIASSHFTAPFLAEAAPAVLVDTSPCTLRRRRLPTWAA